MHINSFSRRTFMSAASAIGASVILPASAHAASPIARQYGPYMKLSLAAYSFHSILPNRASAEDYAKAPMKLEDFVRYCAELNLDGCEPTSYYFPADVTQEYLLNLKLLAFRLGLDISGTAIGNDFALPDGPKRDEQLRMTREWIDHAVVLGAPVIRIFAGTLQQGDSEDVAIDRCIRGINESLDYAAQKGVMLALENHGGITATSDNMLRIINGVKDSPWFGVNFDGGNFSTADPYADLANIAPYAVNVQLKVAISPNGKKGPADLARTVRILQDAGYRGYLVLEYEESENAKEAIPRHIDTLRNILHRGG